MGTILLGVFCFLLLGSIAFVATHIARAVEGFEDETGFHYGDAMPNRRSRTGQDSGTARLRAAQQKQSEAERSPVTLALPSR
jgi:hypothetical protein